MFLGFGLITMFLFLLVNEMFVQHFIDMFVLLCLGF